MVNGPREKLAIRKLKKRKKMLLISPRKFFDTTCYVP